MVRSIRLQGTIFVIYLLTFLAACSALPGNSIEAFNNPVEESFPPLHIVETQTSSVLTSFSNLETAAATDLQTNLIQVYDSVNPSVVYVINSNGTSGSGFVYSEDGLIVTNNHVVDKIYSIEIVFSNGERERAELIGTDVDSDIAILQVDDLPDEVNPLLLASPDSIRPGQFVIAIGNPFGEQGSMSLGIISGLGRCLPSQRLLTSGSTYSLPQVIQTDAPINPGNSGGPLVNLNGEVVGITTAIASDTGTNSGVGFAIPVQAIDAIVPDLIETGTHDYSYLGISFDSEVSLDEQSAYDLSQTLGAYVLAVTKGSPEDEAGITPANQSTGKGGDLIIAINEIPVRNFADLNSYLVFSTTIGQSIELTALRNGQTISLPVVLGERP